MQTQDLIINIILWLFATIVVENITEIVTTDAIFSDLRQKLSRSVFFAKLIGCGRCFSLYPSIAMAAFLPGLIDEIYQYDTIINVPLNALILHRLSNIFHELLSRWFGRHPITMIFHKINGNDVDNKTIDTGDNDE